MESGIKQRGKEISEQRKQIPGTNPRGKFQIPSTKLQIPNNKQYKRLPLTAA
jgi:hypothetical protein